MATCPKSERKGDATSAVVSGTDRSSKASDHWVPKKFTSTDALFLESFGIDYVPAFAFQNSATCLTAARSSSSSFLCEVNLTSCFEPGGQMTALR